MFCSQCGTEAQPTAKFCQKCGKPFASFLPTQPSEVAVEKPRLLQSHETPEAAPLVRQTPQSRPERTPRTASSAPTLWNPGAAASWSLLFSPVFGAYLHMRNWEELGEPEKASSAKLWLYFGIPFSLLPYLGLLYLLVWYFTSGKKQMAYVQEKYGKNYNKKSWGMPIFAAIGIFVTLLVLAGIGGLLIEK